MPPGGVIFVKSAGACDARRAGAQALDDTRHTQGHMELDPDILSEFLAESREGLEQMDVDLVALENGEDPTPIIQRIFRCIHTIKGTSGFMGLEKLERLTHIGENVLAKVRAGELAVTETVVSSQLDLVDAVRSILDRVEAEHSEGDNDYDALRNRLEAIANGEVDSSPAPDASVPTAEGESSTPEALPEPAPAPASPTAPPAEPPSKPASVAPSSDETRSAEATVRVDVGLLDRLMNLVGELVLARNQLLQLSNSSDRDLGQATQRLNLVTGELQEEVMRTRLQPIRHSWKQFPRVVRDLTHAVGKRARLVLDGEATELDRTLIEAIKDPLTHLIRNAVDHGLETPEQRVAAGKDPEGTLMLRAYHEGGQVTIEVADDGRGIAADRVKEKAVAQGAISADEAAKLSPREALNLIFIPALSTADKVSSISGRGVGMDVVRSNIEKIGGAVEITSTPGTGTTCRIRIPLTLAIVPALIVTCGKERFAIPQVSLLELVRVDESRKDVDEIEGVLFYRLRGRLLPLVSLKETLEIEGPDADLSRSRVVVLQSNNQSFGLIVDEVHDTEEIVVKPLGTKLRGLDAFAGATIMGDGSVALILDALGLAQRAGVTNGHPHAEVGGETEAIGDHNAVLHFEADGGLAMSVALGQIARLEEINPQAVERVRSGAVVQYRGSVLRLMELENGQPKEVRDPSRFDGRDDPIPVLVCETDTGSIGLVVEKIVDITLAHQFTGDLQTGLIRVDGNVVELIDLGATLGVRSAA